MPAPEPEHIQTPTYTGPERRSRSRERELHSEIERRLGVMHERLDDGSAKMRMLHEELKTNTESTQRVEANTADVVTILQSAKAAFRFFEFMGKLAKPAVSITMLVGALWGLITTVKGGGVPK